MLDFRGSGFAALRCLFFFAFSMFICLLLLCSISSALTTIDLTKEGRDIDLVLRNPKDKIEKMSNGNVKMTSASIRYRWDVAQYINYIDSMYITINVVNTDDAACNEDGSDWTQFYVYGTDNQWHKWGLLDTTGSIRKELIGSNWSPFRHYSGGKWYVDIRVTAPHCSGAPADADIEISQLKLELKVDSETQLSRSRVNFGKLYFPKYESGGTVNSGALNDTAVDYNEKQEQQIKIKNVGYGNLNWSVKSSPSGLTFSPASGSVARNSEQTITLKLGSPGGTDSNYSQEVVFQTDDGSRDDDKFTILATLYDTPKIQHIPPEVGWKNNIVHVAVDDSEARFEVSEADPLFPKLGGGKLPVKRHEWQSTGQGASPTVSGWRPGQRVATGAEWNWSTPGRYDLHCRMVDDNGVATEPVKISVRVWVRPIVNSEPPDPSAVDWYGNEEAGFAYVGIVGQPVRFQGSASPNPDNNASGESISTYKWYDSSGNSLGTHGQNTAATHTWNDRKTKDTIY